MKRAAFLFSMLLYAAPVLASTTTTFGGSGLSSFWDFLQVLAFIGGGVVLVVVLLLLVHGGDHGRVITGLLMFAAVLAIWGLYPTIAAAFGVRTACV